MPGTKYESRASMIGKSLDCEAAELFWYLNAEMFRENVVTARCIFPNHEILSIRRPARTWQTDRDELPSDIRVMNEALFLERKTPVATSSLAALVSPALPQI